MAALRSPEGSWKREILDEVGFSMFVSLAVDERGVAHLAYAAGPGRGDVRELRHAARGQDGTWTSGVVASAPEGRHVGLTGVASASGKTVVAWELGQGNAFRGKDYGGPVGGVMLTVIQTDGAVDTETLEEPGAGRPSVAADGTLVYVTGSRAQETTLALVDRRGAVLKTIGEPADYHHWPSLSPDGRQIANKIQETIQPRGVGVVIEAMHFCMIMRGVEKQNSKTITSAVRGQLRNAATRAEAMGLITS